MMAAQTEYEYAIVQVENTEGFKDKGIIIVPSSYLIFQDDEVHVRYLEPPFTKNDFDFINDMVKSKAQVPESWSTFHCTLHSLSSK